MQGALQRHALWLAVFCWLLILLIAPLRQMFWIQARGGGLSQGWAYGPMPGSGPIAPLEEVAARYPDDVQAQAVAANTYEPKFGRAYDPLIQRFPGETWLIARRLIAAVSQMSHDRTGGEFSDPNLQANKAAGIPSPERQKYKPNFTRAELEEALAMARRGKQVEPNNAFWDWIEFYLLMGSWRDAQAWRVLEQAARKTEFNDHAHEWIKAKIHTQELQLGRPLLAEEKLAAMFSDIKFPIFSRFREMARIVAWEGTKAERRGDHATALRIYGDFGRLMINAEMKSSEPIDMMVYWAMGAIAFGGNKRNVLQSDVPAGQWRNMAARAKVQARKFGAYAKAHGRADLAQSLTPLIIQAGQHYDTYRRNRLRGDTYSGMPARPLFWSIVWWWASSLTLLILPMFLIWWLLVGFALKKTGVLPAPVVARAVFWPAALTVVLVALCWAAGFYTGAGNSIFGMTAGFDLPEELYAVPYLLLALGLILPGLAASFGVWWGTRREPGAPRPHWRERLRDIRLSAVITSAALTFYVVTMASWWILCLLSAGSSVLSGEITQDLEAAFRISPLWAQLGFTLGVFALWLRWLLALPQNKTLFATRLRRIHATLGALIVIGSASYLLLLAASLPVRREADARINELLQYGEVATIVQNSSSR